MHAQPPHLDYEGFGRVAPAANAALLALSRAVDAAGLDKGLTELVKLRVSQINGCAFCLQLHLALAARHGLPAEKLGLLPAWREAGIFSAQERAALAWAEALTRLGDAGARDADYAAVVAAFGEHGAAWLTVTVGLINSWNRIGIGLGFPIARSGQA